MAERRYDLGAAELEVLNVLWDSGPATVRQVMRRLHDGGRRVAYTTVLTFLTRLEQKGFVRSNKSEIAYVYRAAVTRERVRKSRLSELVEGLYDGAAGPLVLQLVRTGKLQREEIAELHRLIEELDTESRSSTRQRT